ncbi:MAG: hypothetical protein BWY91_03168 [bacterium ADurb.BinA028]|nr:MAG: hypothetical protein BWY91_03168 [bacterium ADurb.BinA028]
MQERPAADPRERPALGQLVGNRDRIGRLAAAIEVEDRLIDRLVGRSIEVDSAQHLDRVGDGVLGQQHRAQHRLLGVDILWRKPIIPRPVEGTGKQLLDRHCFP